MITTFLLALFQVPLIVLGWALGTIAISIPQNLVNSVLYFLSYFDYLRGIIDVDTMFQAIATYLLVFSSYFLFKKFVWLLGIMFKRDSSAVPHMHDEVDRGSIESGKGRFGGRQRDKWLMRHVKLARNRNYKI